MTRTRFRELVAAGDSRADDFMMSQFGWEFVRANSHWLGSGGPWTAEDCWFRKTAEPTQSDDDEWYEMAWPDELPRYATQPDGAPGSEEARRSWALFGEMWERLMELRTQHASGYWGYYSEDVLRRNPVRHRISSTLGVRVDAPTRCAAAAEALLAARRKFEEEG
jgi:hypothetical protein